MNNNDGFERYDSCITTSKPLDYFHQHSSGKEKEFNFLVVQKMDVEGPNLLQKFVVAPLQVAGQNALEGTKNVIAQVPSIFKWGAIGLYNKLTSMMKENPDNKKNIEQKQDQKVEKEEKIEEKEQENFDDIPIVFVVPQSILEAPPKQRQEWIEKHKENYEIFLPREKAFKLNNIGNLKTSSSSSSGPDDCDFDVRRISDEFKMSQTVSDLFPSVDSQKSKLKQSSQYMISEEDYKRIQSQEQTNSNETQNIILYPFLGDMIPKEQILEQYRNYKLQQSEFTIVQDNTEQSQTIQVPQQQQQQQQPQQEQFQPLMINGVPFEKQQNIEKPQEQQQEQPTYEEPQRQLEALLEY